MPRRNPSGVRQTGKLPPAPFLPWVDRVGGRLSDGRRPVVRWPEDDHQTVVGGARVVSGAEKKSFDRGGPVWPPRSNAKYDRSGGGPAKPPQPKPKNFEKKLPDGTLFSK